MAEGRLSQGLPFPSANTLLSLLLLSWLSGAADRNFLGICGPSLGYPPLTKFCFLSKSGLVLVAAGATEVGRAWSGPAGDHQPAGASWPAALWGLTLTTLSTLMGEFWKQFSLRNEQMVSTALFT